jgi:hypothetical protein
MSVYKKLNPSDVSIKTFRLHKSKQFTNSTLSSLGVQEKYARLRVINTSSEDTISAKNIIDLNDNNIVHNQLNHLYYKEKDLNYYDSFGIQDPLNTEKKLFGEANILSIPRSLYGYEIKPGTIIISGSFNGDFTQIGVIIKDDAKGNLYDSSFVTSSFISNNNRVLYLDFRDQIDKIDEFKSN